MKDLSISSSMRTFRVMLGLSQTELAKLCGMSQNSISSIERGEYGVSLKHALLIARALHVRVDDIWCIDDERLDSPCDICLRSECVGCSLGYPSADDLDLIG